MKIASPEGFNHLTADGSWLLVNMVTGRTCLYSTMLHITFVMVGHL